MRTPAAEANGPKRRAPCPWRWRGRCSKT